MGNLARFVWNFILILVAGVVIQRLTGESGGMTFWGLLAMACVMNFLGYIEGFVRGRA